MALIAHTFTREGHAYRVNGGYVLSTSDILTLNGLCLFEGVPAETLALASLRGQMVHEAVQCFEIQVELPKLPRSVADDVRVRFAAYKRWKEKVGFEVCGPIERSIVYQHHGTDMLVGGTPDIIGKVNGEVFVVDLKTCARQSGKAKQMKMFEWRLQTQSYLEGLAEDEQLWKTIDGMKRGVLHLHPQCGIEVRGGERLGYEWNEFNQDDSAVWSAAVAMAQAKLSAGHPSPTRR